MFDQPLAHIQKFGSNSLLVVPHLIMAPRKVTFNKYWQSLISFVQLNLWICLTYSQNLPEQNLSSMRQRKISTIRLSSNHVCNKLLMSKNVPWCFKQMMFGSIYIYEPVWTPCSSCTQTLTTMRCHLPPPCVDSFPRLKLKVHHKLRPSIGVPMPSSGTIVPPASKAPAPALKGEHTPGQTPIKSPEMKKVKISDPTPPEHPWGLWCGFFAYSRFYSHDPIGYTQKPFAWLWWCCHTWQRSRGKWCDWST